MNQPSVSDLLRGFAEVPESFDREIGQLALDSRDVRPGALFLATAGTQRHGIEFAAQAERAGAVAIAWEPDPELAGELDALAVPVFAVPELGRRAGLIADRFYGSPSKHLQVLGVTGTNGKTSVSHFIAQALDGAPLRCGLIGTLGAGLFGELQPATHTTPDAIQVHRLLASFVAQGAGFAAMEVSSHALDQGRVNGVRFAVGLFTNLSRDHLDYHGDMGRYAAAKRRLFTEHSPRHAVINADDAVGRRLLQDLPSLVKPLAYSLRGAVPGIDTLYARRLHLTASGTVIEVESPWGSATFSSPLLGAFNAANLLAALGALLALGLPLHEAIDRLAKVTAVAGRMERLGGGERPMVVIDYAHTPDALEQTLKALRAHTDGRLICVFGCGGDRDAGKRPLMGRCVEMHANLGIITDDNPRTEDPAEIVRAIKDGLMQPQRMPVVHDRRLAIVQALELARPGDCVLIAGKGHEDYQIVGHERRPFSDREVAHAWLEGRAT